MTDADLAARAAEAAGRLLADLQAQGRLAGAELGAEGDLVANQLILATLREHRPDDGILSEESPDLPDRLEKSRVWIVDPLDGTREYAAGRRDWAVHVALAVDGEAAAGAVAVPACSRLYRSDSVGLAPRDPGGRPRIAISRSRPPRQAGALAAAIGADLVEMGSAGAKAMAVVAGRVDVYFHAGGQHEWDNCAPVSVALAAGLHASRCDGTPLRYNRAPPFVPDLLICRPEFAEAVLGALAAL